MTVHTPPVGTPTLTTIVQLDGDIVSYVSASLLRDYPGVDERAALLADHQRAVSSAMPRLPRMDRATWMLVGGTTGIIEGAAIGFDVFAGAGLSSLWIHVAGLAPLGFRGTALRLVLRLLRDSTNRVIRRERAAICRQVATRGLEAIKRDHV